MKYLAPTVPLAVLLVACAPDPRVQTGDGIPTTAGDTGEPQEPRREAQSPNSRAEQCSEIEAESARALELEGLGDGTEAENLLLEERWAELTRSLGRCIEAGTGAWVLRPVAMRPVVAEGGQPGVAEVAFRCEYVTAAGAVHHCPGEPVTLSRETFEGGLSGQGVEIIAATDLDADGVPELAYRRTEFGPDYGSSTDVILTFSDGSVREMGIPDGTRFVDHDQDGQLDMVRSTRWRCRFYNDMEGTSAEGGCPHVLWHGTEEGFSSTDRVAAEYLRSRCPSSPTRLIEPDPPDYCWPERGGGFINIACARIWGATSDAVQQRIRSEYGRLREECRSDEQLTDMLAHAEIDPPVTIASAD